MKKICTVFAIFTIIALCLFLLPTKSKAAEIPSTGVCGENLIFTYVNDLLMIQGTGPMAEYDYENRPPWECDQSPIKRIVIHEGVTTISETAFNSCNQLEELTLPSTLTSIGKGAFTSCNLTTLVLPDSLESIGDSAFAYCDNLTSVTLGAGLKTIGNSAFYNCPKLASITIPANVNKIDDYAFSTCTSLKKIQVDPNNETYTSDESGALYDKILTTLIQAPGGITGSYTVPATVKVIGTGAFSACRGLTEVNLPEGLTTISTSAFSFCTNLTTITIPNTVTKIGETPFRYCTSLTYNEYGNAQYLGSDKNPYAVLVSVTTQTATEYSIHENTKFICDRAFMNCAAVTSITIPDTVVYLGGWAFSRCYALTNVVIGNGVRQIKNATFMDCNALETVILGSKVELIDEQAFYACYALKSINLPRGLTTIGRMAFAGCINLTSVILPAGIATVDFDAFAYCEKLTGVTFCGTEAQWEKYKIGFYSTPLENIQVTYHAPEEATCTRASTCRLCGETFGDPLGHSPGDEPTETTAQKCTVCGVELAPALNTATTPPTQATVPSTPQTAPDGKDASDEEDSHRSAVIWIIIGTVIAAGGGTGGYFLFRKCKLQKPQESPETQE